MILFGPHASGRITSKVDLSSSPRAPQKRINSFATAPDKREDSKAPLFNIREGAACAKVGGRLYKADAPLDGSKGAFLNLVLSLQVLHTLSGPLLQLDLMRRPVQEKSIVEFLKSLMPLSDPYLFPLSEDLKAQWLQCCISATVVTSYNSRVYRIKEVHFDMRPKSKFTMRMRGQPDVEVSFEEYLKTCYGVASLNQNQPVLEAYPDKKSERTLPDF